MKRFLSFILLFIFLFNISGYYYLFCVLQQSLQNDIKQEIRNGLKESDLSLIVCSADDENEVCWIKPGKEFRYEGELFDIVKIKTVGNQRHYFCIKDINEKQLIEKYNQNQSSKNDAKKRLQRTIFKQYFLGQSFFNGNIASTAYQFNEISFSYKSIDLSICSPPPKMLLV